MSPSAMQTQPVLSRRHHVLRGKQSRELRQSIRGGGDGMHNELSRAAVAASHTVRKVRVRYDRPGAALCVQGCVGARTRGRSRRRLQPVLHVALRVVPAAQHLAARRHCLVGQVLEQVVQQARVACALTRREMQIQMQNFKSYSRGCCPAGPARLARAGVCHGSGGRGDVHDAVLGALKAPSKDGSIRTPGSLHPERSPQATHRSHGRREPA